MRYVIESSRSVGKKKYDQVYKTLELVFEFAAGNAAVSDNEQGKSFYVDLEDVGVGDVDYIVDMVNDIFGTKFFYDEIEEEETQDD